MNLTDGDGSGHLTTAEETKGNASGEGIKGLINPFGKERFR